MALKLARNNFQNVFTFCNLVIFCIILSQIAKPSTGVINKNYNNKNVTSSNPISENDRTANQEVKGSNEEVYSSNDQITFQYEPDEFNLTHRRNDDNVKLGKTNTSTTTSTINKPNLFQSTEPTATDAVKLAAGEDADRKLVTEANSQRNFLLPPPTSRTSSSRGGRMLDLDALMGERSHIRERSMSGNRQSRGISSNGQSIDLGNKKLKIQGFIPIVSMKDDDSPSSESDGSDQQQDIYGMNMKQQHQRLLQAATSSSSGDNLPYAQSSMGHASFGVQRFPQQQQQQLSQSQNEAPQFINDNNNHQSMTSSVVDSLKRPLKRLASLTSVGSENKKQSSGGIIGQDCLCVPFYMCKNGFVSESSISRAQIQQMIIAQQQGQRNSNQMTSLASLGSSIATSPEDNNPSYSSAIQQLQSSNNQLASSGANQPQYADSIVPVDERSMDRDMINNLNFANSITSADNQDNKNINQTTGEQDTYPSIQLISSDNGNNVTQQEITTAKAPTSEDYSQEILGRMLGLRAPSRMGSSPASGNGLTQSSSGGGCGVLRTCCAIPPHILAGHLSQSLSDPFGSQSNSMIKQQQQQLQQSSMLHNQQVMQQRFAPSNTQSMQKMPMNLPYGFPFGAAASAAMTMMQPANFNNQFTSSNYQDPQLSTALAHRSTQFQQANNNNQYQQMASQIRPMNQMPPSMMGLQQQPSMASQVLASQPPSWQQQQQMKQMNSNSLSNGLIRQQPFAASQAMRTSAASSTTGTRKILDGRCGLRQSSGITGRVQNLQYQENSADFGEYPAQAAILKKLSGSDSLFVCGGTLISQYWIATAAHCIKKHMSSELKVRLGEWDVHRDDEFYPFVEKEIRDVVIHPEFVSGNLVNDIALLRLDSAVDPTLPHVNPACLPNLDENFTRQRCWVTGWGKDSFGHKGTFQSVLQEVELPVAGHGECEMALKQTRLGSHYRLHPGFICAGGEGGRDACEGDGGSGLYCIQDGIIKVAGLVSWGIGCGQAGVPGVYVNMAHYRTWIENIIAIDEDVYSPFSNTLASGIISERSNDVATNNKTDSTSQTLDLQIINSTLTIPSKS